MDIFKFHLLLEGSAIRTEDDASVSLSNMAEELDESLGFEYRIVGWEYLGTFDSPGFVFELSVETALYEDAKKAVERNFVENPPEGVSVEHAVV